MTSAAIRLRPIRSYFYWDKHCYDIPVCFALRFIFDALDSIDLLTEKFEDLTAGVVRALWAGRDATNGVRWRSEFGFVDFAPRQGIPI
jgi:hypothetical protein